MYILLGFEVFLHNIIYIIIQIIIIIITTATLDVCNKDSARGKLD